MSDPDEVLPGGNANRGYVVRKGNRVHRPATENSRVVEAVLRYLEAAGYDAAPKFEGSDSEGRDVLSWVEGTVYSTTLPAWISAPTTVAKVSSLVRRLHDALRDFADPFPWKPKFPAPPSLRGDQLCHGDVGFGNVVFRGHDPIALIDFEFIVRADPLLDVAAIASQWTPVPRAPAEDTAARRGRVKDGVVAVASSYGLTAVEKERLPDAMIAIEESAIAYIDERAADGDEVARTAVHDGTLARRAFRRDWMRREAPRLGQALV